MMDELEILYRVTEDQDAENAENPAAAVNRALDRMNGGWILFLEEGSQLAPETRAAMEGAVAEWQGQTPMILLPLSRLEGGKTTLHRMRGYKGRKLFDLAEKRSAMIPVRLNGILFDAGEINRLGLRLREDIGLPAAEARFIAELLAEKPIVGNLPCKSIIVPFDSALELLRKDRARTEPAEWIGPEITELLEKDSSEFIQRFALTALTPRLHCYATWNEHTPDADYMAAVRKELARVLPYIGNSTILADHALNARQRYFLLKEKNGKDFRVEESDETGAASTERTPVLEFIRYLDGEVLVTFVRTVSRDVMEHSRPYALVNGTKQYTNEDTAPQVYSVLGETVAGRIGFTAAIRPDPKAGKTTVTFGYETDGQDEPMTEFHCARTSAVRRDSFQYADCGEYLARVRKEKLILKRKTPVRHIAYELRYLLKLACHLRDRSCLDAIRLRLMYYKHRLDRDTRQVWLINDRIGKADDNGEALFRYLCENRKDTVRAIYVIDGKSPDFERLKQYGEVIDPADNAYKPLSLYADVSAGSHLLSELINPFGTTNDFVLDLINRRVVAFIRHGISKDDMSSSYNRHNGKFSMITAASRGEAASLTEPSYGLNPNQVYLIGLARFDLLYNAPAKKIVIMPTWRKYLVSKGLENRSRRVVTGDLENSRYFRAYSAVLRDKTLFDTAERLGYQMIFVQHPAMKAADIRPFDADPRLITVEQADCYRDLFAEADLMVTDFSSVAFDFAYLYKPLIYFQPDAEEFFGQHYLPGYFEYHRDGLGDVIETPEELSRELIAYMENGCQLKEAYRGRIDAFYPYRDQKNRERLADTIYDFTRRSHGRAGKSEEVSM